MLEFHICMKISHSLKIVAVSAYRKKNTEIFVGPVFSSRFYCRNQIAVCRNYYSGVIFVIYGILCPFA